MSDVHLRQLERLACVDPESQAQLDRARCRIEGHPWYEWYRDLESVSCSYRCVRCEVKGVYALVFLERLYGPGALEGIDLSWLPQSTT